MSVIGASETQDTTWQLIAALAIVASALAVFAWRFFRKRKDCGTSCGCG